MKAIEYWDGRQWVRIIILQDHFLPGLPEGRPAIRVIPVDDDGKEIKKDG